jgi:hypothetical protein
MLTHPFGQRAQSCAVNHQRNPDNNDVTVECICTSIREFGIPMGG